MDETPNLISAVPFISAQRVFWDQLDLLGVLHNAAYLLLFERARTDFWQSLGVSGYGDEKLDWPFLVVRNEVNYRAPITSEGTVHVSVWISKLGASSLTFAHEVRCEDGALAADGQTVIVRVDADSPRPIRWTPRFRDMVAPYVRA